MKTVYLCGGTRFDCFSELVASGVVELKAVICSNSKYIKAEVNDLFKSKCMEHEIPFYLVEKGELKSVCSEIDFELLISVGYRFIIESAVLEKSKIAINLHPTLLPKYRGYRSGPFIIMNNERETGVTLHYIDNGMDTGDIILQKKIVLSSFDTVKSMSLKTSLIEGAVLIEGLNLLLENRVSAIKQNESDATVFNQIRTPKDSEIDPNKSIKDLYNVIRACDPDEYPAFFYVDGEKVCIKLWRPKAQNKYEI